MVPFTRATLLNRVRWNALALAGLFVLPKVAPVQGIVYLVYGVVSIVSGGGLDAFAESVGEYSVLLAKVLIGINLLDALVRLQNHDPAASQAPTSGPIKGSQAAKLALGVRSSPQTRPSPGAALGIQQSSSSPSTAGPTGSTSRLNHSNPLRAPLFLPPDLRASLDEASVLATPSRTFNQLAASAGPGFGAEGLGNTLDSSHGAAADSSFRSTGLSASLGGGGRRLPSGSPASGLAALHDGSRNASPVSLFRARRAVSGRGRSTSGLQFDSSFDAGDDDGSSASHEVEYGLDVLNSSFSADTSHHGPATGGPLAPFSGRK